MKLVWMNILMATALGLGVVGTIFFAVKRGMIAARSFVDGFICVYVVLGLIFAWITRAALPSKAWFLAGALVPVIFTVSSKLVLRTRRATKQERSNGSQSRK